MTKANEDARKMQQQVQVRVANRQAQIADAQIAHQGFEAHPSNSEMTIMYTYFSGSPSQEQLAQLAAEMEVDVSDMTVDPNPISDAANMERWTGYR